MKMPQLTDSDVHLAFQVVKKMKGIEGWLDEMEATLMVGVTAHVLREIPGTAPLVEIGSYCGRSTVVLGSVIKVLSPGRKLWAIDPHEGHVGDLVDGTKRTKPTFDRFMQNIEMAGLSEWIVPLRQFSYEVIPKNPLPLLYIDGFHDSKNVSRDFHHFEPWIINGGYILFHDYAEYYPGVKTFVDELIKSPAFHKVHCVQSLIVVQKVNSSGDQWLEKQIKQTPPKA